MDYHIQIIDRQGWIADVGRDRLGVPAVYDAIDDARAAMAALPVRAGWNYARIVAADGTVTACERRF